MAENGTPNTANVGHAGSNPVLTTKTKVMFVKYKPTKETFEVKRIRKSGKVELMNGVVIPEIEFERNWEFVK